MIARTSLFALAIGVAALMPAQAQVTSPPTAGPITSPLSGIHSAPVPQRQDAATPAAPQPAPPAPAVPGR